MNLYSRTDTDEKWINNNYNFGINDCRACNLWQNKFGRVLEPLVHSFVCTEPNHDSFTTETDSVTEEKIFWDPAKEILF